MSIFKCKMCGGDLEVAEGIAIAECDYCGAKQTVPKATDENLQNLFNRANTLRIKSEFDKAERLYEKIIQADTTQAEAYWGLILCKYGIEYVDDPATFKKIPTCHRASYDSIIADDDYKSAIENADISQRALYEVQAKEIDRIQRDILALAQKEESYDVFICYKETDANGKRTQDSVIANDIYYQLTQEGFKVFYAAITLEGKLGSAYEPIIFAALNSAKVMLAIGTRPEYFNAVWVKNEWSRFLKLIQKDRSRLLIPCYRNMDAYELPEEFAHLQALDMAKIGFINDVVRGIKKIIKKDEPKPIATVREPVVTTTNANIAPLLKRAFMFLEDGDWERADEFCEQVLNQDPENAQAYLGKLMAELRVKKQESLKDLLSPFDSKNNYQKALRFADAPLKATLTGYIEHINTRNENQRLESIYAQATLAMKNAKSEAEYRNAGDKFATILSYKDSKSLHAKCHGLAKTARKDEILASAKENMKAKTIDSYEVALSLLASIRDWKDANDLLSTCQSNIDRLRQQAEQERLERERQEEAARLERERERELARRKAEQNAKRNKKIAIITAPIVCGIIAFIFVLNFFFIPNSKYNDAVELMDKGKYVDAYEALTALNGYKDSSEKAASIYKEYLYELTKVGAYISFGAYEQDNDTSNGKEEIEWLVLDKKDNKILVISRYALDCKQFGSSYVSDTWDSCTLRAWLNNEFMNAAFSAEEQAMISTVEVSADANPSYDTSPGNVTQDQIFLLSIAEVNTYFTSDEARQCHATDYAIAQGTFTGNSRNNCSWWLRTSGVNDLCTTLVERYGTIHEAGVYHDYTYNAVRPAMWIDMSN